MRRFAPHILAGLVPLLLLAFYVAVLRGLVDPDVLFAHRDALQQAVDARPVAALVAFAASYIVSTSLGLPVGGVLGLLAGILFGRWIGLGVVVLAGTSSAFLVYWAACSTYGRRLQRRAGPIHTRLSSAMQENAFAYLLFMRLVPLFPFFVVTVVAALLGVRARTFLLATIIGKVPVNFIYAGLGQQIGQATSVRDLLTAQSLSALTALSVLALAPVLLRWLKPRLLPVRAVGT